MSQESVVEHVEYTQPMNILLEPGKLSKTRNSQSPTALGTSSLERLITLNIH
jgi:hypothetical protein